MSNSEKSFAEIFVAKARAKHGRKYSYDLVNYVNKRTKVTIVCPQHGRFEQTPCNHRRGRGCPECYRQSLLRSHPNGVIVEYRGVTYSSYQAAARSVKSGVSASTIGKRIRGGMTVAEAIETPVAYDSRGGTVYLISCETDRGKQYVGSTTKSLQVRLQGHVEKANNRQKNASGGLHEAIIKFGIDAFVIESIGVADDGESLTQLERHHIEVFGTLKPHGYNSDEVCLRVNRGGGNGGTKLNLEKAEVIRAKYGRGGITQKKLADEYGVSRSMVGRIVSNVAWQISSKNTCEGI